MVGGCSAKREVLRRMTASRVRIVGEGSARDEPSQRIKQRTQRNAEDAEGN